MWTPVADSRRANERLIFERLRRGGSASRAQLAKAVGLSAPTVGKVADTLLGIGLLEEVEADGQIADPVLGRPSRPLRLSRGQHRVVALQIGVRRTRLAALPVAGPIDDQPERNWPVQFATPRRASTWVTRLTQAARKLNITTPWAVAISVPGVVDEQAGSVLLSPNLHWLESHDIVALTRNVWSAPAVLVQEIRALALGHLSAADQNAGDFLLVDVGEGVGGAVMDSGQLRSGALPLSGELGHTAVPGNSRTCGCGAIGCVETLASRQGLLQSWRHHSRRSRATWDALTQHIGDHGVEPWLATTLDALAGTIGGAMNVLGVRHVVVTGALTELPPAVMKHLAAGVERSSMWARFGTVVCEAAPRRRAAGLVSAAIDRVLLPPVDSTWRMAERRESL